MPTDEALLERMAGALREIESRAMASVEGLRIAHLALALYEARKAWGAPPEATTCSVCSGNATARCHAVTTVTGARVYEPHEPSAKEAQAQDNLAANLSASRIQRDRGISVRDQSRELGAGPPGLATQPHESHAAGREERADRVKAAPPEPAPPADRSEHSAECMKEHAAHPENCYLGAQECPPRSRCPRCNPKAPRDFWANCRALADAWRFAGREPDMSEQYAAGRILDAISRDEAASRDAEKEGT